MKNSFAILCWDKSITMATEVWDYSHECIKHTKQADLFVDR